MEIPQQKLLGNNLWVPPLSDFQGSTIRVDLITEKVLLNRKYGCFKSNAEKQVIILHFSFLFWKVTYSYDFLSNICICQCYAKENIGHKGT